MQSQGPQPSSLQCPKLSQALLFLCLLILLLINLFLNSTILLLHLNPNSSCFGSRKPFLWPHVRLVRTPPKSPSKAMSILTPTTLFKPYMDKYQAKHRRVEKRWVVGVRLAISSFSTNYTVHYGKGFSSNHFVGASGTDTGVHAWGQVAMNMAL